MSLEVVSFAEFFGDNPRIAKQSDRVVGNFALSGAEDLSTTINKLVGRPGSLVTQESVNHIKQQQFLLLLEELAAKREAGLLNDTQTSSDDIALRGVKMVVVTRTNPHRTAGRIADRFGGDHPTICSIATAEETDDYALLGIGFDNARFREIVTPDLRKQGELTHNISVYGYLNNEAFDLARTVPMHFFLPEVVRLETLGGDLWQNPNYTTTGLALASAQ